MNAKLDIEKLFSVIDEKNTAGFCAFLTPDCILRFGNQEPVTGRDNVFSVMEEFFNSIQSLSHDVECSWYTGNAVICYGTVHYTRHDGSKLSVAYANILKLSGDLISDYLIFIDISELHK